MCESDLVTELVLGIDHQIPGGWVIRLALEARSERRGLCAHRWASHMLGEVCVINQRFLMAS